MFDDQDRFCMENYQQKPTFSGFLPGICGMTGIPVWCFYVNRGQAIASFGVENKEQSIMEFFPAHQSYQFVKTMGFRTFMKVDGRYSEAFTGGNKASMAIGLNDLVIETDNEKIKTSVLYFTLPYEKVGGLVRQVTLTNTDDVAHGVQVLDGMPALIPYGISLSAIKEMGQTAKAWMQVEDVVSKLPFFKARVSMKDSIAVQTIEGGHFALAIDDEGELCSVFTDPEQIFAYDTSLQEPVGFIQESLSTTPGNDENIFPCCFFAKTCHLEPGQSMVLYEIYGQSPHKTLFHHLAAKCNQVSFFQEKHDAAITLTENLCQGISTKTASHSFDLYCKQTYLDNIMRGGYPVLLGKNKVFYLYSRKHGDLERDYNQFSMTPEYLSQGNGNFRDINQNRRCDVRFIPAVGRDNIYTFFNLIQLDGYNPLEILQRQYRLALEKAATLFLDVDNNLKQALTAISTQPFTPGQLLGCLTDHCQAEEAKLIFDQIMNQADFLPAASLKEGYWSDHWTYNLDLIESYLSIYPEEEVNLLYDDFAYDYFEPQAQVNPRSKRYEVTDAGVRQYHTLSLTPPAKESATPAYPKACLMEKLLLLCALKTATLDPYGMGIEMEGGKPGWYDALNGLPGLLGSSMSESYELLRLLLWTENRLTKYQRPVRLKKEIYDLIMNLDKVTPSVWQGILSWNQFNQVKESYRSQMAQGINKEQIVAKEEELLSIIQKWRLLLEQGVNAAIAQSSTVCPTYFYYEVTEYTNNAQGVCPQAFIQHSLRSFLEGSVHVLKLPLDLSAKKSLYLSLKNSPLFDQKLKMYKVNASLTGLSYEVGRATAFTPGWLENESIWLHMEYKYLLELLKSGLYEEYFEEMPNLLVPFLDPAIYGRSVTENSSFIVSSANPNLALHGRGFVARLSGSTAEFLQMWQIMMFGQNPFGQTEEGLTLKFIPAFPAYLLDENCQITGTFLSQTSVIYQFNRHQNVIPGQYQITRQLITFKSGQEISLYTHSLGEILAQKIRQGEATVIKIWIDLM